MGPRPGCSGLGPYTLAALLGAAPIGWLSSPGLLPGAATTTAAAGAPSARPELGSPCLLLEDGEKRKALALCVRIRILFGLEWVCGACFQERKNRWLSCWRSSGDRLGALLAKIRCSSKEKYVENVGALLVRFA